MNKKEIRNAITKEVCSFVTNLGYSIDDDGFHGSLTFMKPESKTHDDSIEWNRTYQEAVTVNWASDETKADCEAIDAHMKPIIKYLNDQYVNKHAASEDIGPEYDSAGFTEDDRIVNGQYRNI